MRDNYDSGGRRSGGDCTAFPANFTGEAAYTRGTATGRLLCTTNEGGSRYLVWTDERLLIQGFAFQGGQPKAMID